MKTSRIRRLTLRGFATRLATNLLLPASVCLTLWAAPFGPQWPTPPGENPPSPGGGVPASSTSTGGYVRSTGTHGNKVSYSPYGMSFTPYENDQKRHDSSSSASSSRLAPRADYRQLGSDPWVLFLVNSVNMYAISSDPADQGDPIVPLYTDFQAGGTYGVPDAITNVTVDDNNPDAARGTSSYQMSWDGSNGNGYFQFDTGLCIQNRPRNIPDFGMARKVRFYSKGDIPGRQVQINIYRVTTRPCNFALVASQWFSLSTSWTDYVLDISSAGLRPQDLHAVQFLMDSTHDAGGGTVLLDEVRIDSDGFDPLRGVQSYIAHWADRNSPPGTTQWRDANLYPNRSYLYDNALGIEALLVGGYTTAATNIADGRLATASDCNSGFFNELNSGHILLGDGSPRGPSSLRKRLGDNSRFGLALLELFYATRNAQYRDCARQISDWAESNLKASGQYEGYYAGFDDSGSLMTVRSTEENSDLFMLNEQLASLFGQAYADRETWAGTFVVAMFDRMGGKFWTGTSSGDTINTSSVPLDAQTISFLTLGLSQQYAGTVSYTNAIAWAENNLIVTDGLFTGFTFSTVSDSQSEPRVWFEGVAQGCVAYEILGRLEPVSPDPWGAKVPDCLQTLENASVDGTGVLAASSDDLEDTVLNTFYDARLAVAPTSWAVFVRSLLSLR